MIDNKLQEKISGDVVIGPFNNMFGLNNDMFNQLPIIISSPIRDFIHTSIFDLVEFRMRGHHDLVWLTKAVQNVDDASAFVSEDQTMTMRQAVKKTLTNLVLEHHFDDAIGANTSLSNNT
jgi:hypothetical protein